jgi:hypothetical protein
MNLEEQRKVYLRDSRQCIRCSKNLAFEEVFLDRIRTDPFPGYNLIKNHVTLCETCYYLRNIAWEEVPFFKTYLAIKYANEKNP